MQRLRIRPFVSVRIDVSPADSSEVRDLNPRPNKSDLKAVATVNGDHPGTGLSRQDGNPLRFSANFANFKLLLLAPAAAGILAFAGASLLPRSYTSVAYLRLDESGAQAAAARMRSVPAIDRVLSRYQAPGSSIEARRAYIERNMRFMVAPGEGRPKDRRLYRIDYSDRSPVIARTVNQHLLEAWLEMTKPGIMERAAIDDEIRRLEAQAKAAQTLIDDLQSEAREPSLRNMRRSLAEMILSLSARQEETLSRIALLESSLAGVSRDIIVGEPTLPEEPSWPNRAIIVILTVAAVTLLLPVLLMARPAWRALSRNAGHDGSAVNP